MDEILHSGIKGMKWGVRRFQNEDGSLTAAGKERYNPGSDSKDKKAKRLSMFKKVVSAAKNVNGVKSDGPMPSKHSVGEKVDGPMSAKKTPAGMKSAHEDHKRAFDNKPVEEMSDIELRNRLNRINMEKQYKSFNPKKVQRGYDGLKNALAVAGTVTLALGTAIKFKSQIDTIAKWLPAEKMGDIILK